MKRKEQLQQLFDEFQPFIFEEEERRELDKEIIDEFQPFFDKLNTSNTCTVLIERLDTTIPSVTYSIEITRGLKQFFHNMVEFKNKMNVETNVHATEGALEEESEIRMKYFLADVFNRRSEAELQGEKIEDFFTYVIDEVIYFSEENSLYISWFDQDTDSLTFTFS